MSSSETFTWQNAFLIFVWGIKKLQCLSKRMETCTGLTMANGYPWILLFNMGNHRKKSSHSCLKERAQQMPGTCDWNYLGQGWSNGLKTFTLVSASALITWVLILDSYETGPCLIGITNIHPLNKIIWFTWKSKIPPKKRWTEHEVPPLLEQIPWEFKFRYPETQLAYPKNPNP